MSSPLITDLVLFSESITPNPLYPAKERLIAGDPKQLLWNHYSDPSAQFHAGVWQGEPGAWEVRYTEHEFCHLIEGRVRLSDQEGNSMTLVAGDQFVIPAGFRGTWETLETCRKIYVIFEPREQP
ncbi:hypothetical protein G114_17499 [Aeromonas diversa CDC 2478-85]|uniref:(S)-ureidoglycine aminohydrolase cupin domain-containing protein n=1 Tax=Aeromonas diversa CDC 2478-85 TaxID=1268237 RepID=N9VG52_9GAMM|nr:cupin domain-containing protein [Aeromonas diversa]ENY70603.1 hypothetical protein G114_17499 [Aeromonas diversa CDC 2478-85]